MPRSARVRGPTGSRPFEVSGRGLRAENECVGDHGGSPSTPENGPFARARPLDPELVALAEQGLALLDACLPSGPVDAIARVELVAQQALVQARNTIHAAWLLLFEGFEIQALALARLITEYAVLSWYVRSGLGDPQVWLQMDKPPPSSGAQLKALERAGAPLPELAGYATAGRALMHRLAHQDPVAFSFNYRLADGRPSFFRSGGTLDHLSLPRGGEFLVPLTAFMLDSVTTGQSDERDLFDRMADAWWEHDAGAPRPGRASPDRA